jgi:hypothetical protein
VTPARRVESAQILALSEHVPVEARSGPVSAGASETGGARSGGGLVRELLAEMWADALAAPGKIMAAAPIFPAYLTQTFPPKCVTLLP